MDWNEHIEQLEKNVSRYREAQNRIERSLEENWMRSLLPISRVFVEDLLHTLQHNNCNIWIFRNPVSYMNGNMYSAKTHRFDKTEDTINYFSRFHDCDIGIFQVYGRRVISPESFERITSIMVRYATNWSAAPWFDENGALTSGMLKPKKQLEFLTIEEMTF